MFRRNHHNAKVDSSINAWLILTAGVTAALHIGKVPPALPSLQLQLQMSLYQSGWFLALIQLGGLCLGMVLGLLSQAIGAKRSLWLGLATLGATSYLGASANSVPELMLWRCAEGFSYLLAAVSCPVLLRRVVRAERLTQFLGIWSAYLPGGVALAMLLASWSLPHWGWQGWWQGLGAWTLFMAALTAWRLPGDTQATLSSPVAKAYARSLASIRECVRSPGPWLVASAFLVYAAQWAVLIGFLPSIYVQAGFQSTTIGWLTFTLTAINIVGNLGSGVLLQRGASLARVTSLAFAAMVIGFELAFGPIAVQFGDWEHGVRYLGVLACTCIGGLIPGCLFACVVKVAPSPQSVSASVGLMMQFSALGQFVSPPLVAALVERAGSWHVATGFSLVCAALGVLLTRRLSQSLQTSRLSSP